MYAFIHIPKTAGTSLRSHLRVAYGARHCDIKVPARRRRDQPWILPRDLREAKVLYPSPAGICGHRVTCFTGLDDVAPSIGYFTFLRDPAKRFISHFHHAYRGRTDRCTIQDLAAYADHPDHCNIQTRWLCGREDVAQAIENLESRIGFVGLTEQFDTSQFLLCHRLGLPSPPRNRRALNPCRGAAPLDYFHDPSLMKIITGANRLDLEVYRHAAEVCFPRQCAEYGETLAEDMNRCRQAAPSEATPREPLWAQLKRSLFYKPMLHLPWA